MLACEEALLSRSSARTSLGLTCWPTPRQFALPACALRTALLLEEEPESCVPNHYALEP